MTRNRSARRVSAFHRASAALLVALALAFPASAGHWQVSGVVLTAVGAPAAGATVRLRTPTGNTASTVTDAGGAYAIEIDDISGSGTATIWAVLGGVSSPIEPLTETDPTRNLTLGEF